MKIYEYARIRKIKSRDVVRKLKELGINHVKNHLSLVPEKLLPDLDLISFETPKKVKPAKPILVTVALECAPFSNLEIGEKVQNKIRSFLHLKERVTVIIPRYHMDLSLLTEKDTLRITVNSREESVKVYQAVMNDVTYYFLDHEMFQRELLYGYVDDPVRFALFALSALEVIKKLEAPVSTISVHDWPLGLFPLLVTEAFPASQKPKTLFTPYQVTYQGIYGVEVLTEVFGLNRKYFDENKIAEYASSVNFLKAGLVSCDKLDIDEKTLFSLKESYLRAFVYDNKL